MARKNEPYIYKVLRRETPNPRQQAFFRAEAANIAYGGAAARAGPCGASSCCWRCAIRG